MITRHTAEPMATVIIPAHDEAAVLASTLAPLAPMINDQEIEVIVVCNGCTDDTAAVARAVTGVRVIEISEASKTAALNAGDAVARTWPRIYLDADVVVTREAILAVVRAFCCTDVLAARPMFRYEVNGSPVVAAYYRTRTAIPALMSRHLWGAGVYALSEAGHRRLGRFPQVTADDVWVDAQFARHEVDIVTCEPVVVRVPRTAGALLRTLRRVYRGNHDVGAELQTGSTTIGHADVVRTVRGPRSAVDAAVYVGVALVGRRAAATGVRRNGWDRDLTTRRTSTRPVTSPQR